MAVFFLMHGKNPLFYTFAALSADIVCDTGHEQGYFGHFVGRAPESNV
jgi:hypothetical protein